MIILVCSLVTHDKQSNERSNVVFRLPDGIFHQALVHQGYYKSREQHLLKLSFLNGEN